MNVDAAIRYALTLAQLPSEIVSTRSLTGGCIHHVFELTLAGGQRIVAKANHERNLSLVQEEAAGLRALAATDAVLTPEPLAVCAHGGAAALLMTAIVPATTSLSEKEWRRFGEELAALHQADAGHRYGFETDNHIGSTVQPNGWHADWVDFNTLNRLGFQLNLAMENELLQADEAEAVQRVIDRLDHFIPRHPKPALLHGDLWSGNALPAHDGRIALIDPACSIGDGWADIAKMQLFGGFPQACFEAYAAAVNDSAQLHSRVAVYQLYHLLNHINIFGRGYANQALDIVNRLLR